MCRSTNLKNKGLISAPRKRSFARLLTIPCFIVKSSAKDLSSTIFSFDNRGRQTSASASPATLAQLVPEPRFYFDKLLNK